MVTMKADKSGGCAVLATIWVIANLGLPIEVHGIVGAVFWKYDWWKCL